jgi:hypothetical protein
MSLPSGPHPSIPPPSSRQPTPISSSPRLASPHPITPRRPASSIETPIKTPYSLALIPPLESPLTPSPAINGLGCKLPAVTHRYLHPEQPRPPINGENHPGVSPHPSPPLFSSLHAWPSFSLSTIAADSTPLSPGLHVAPPPRVRP